ncbi:MAG: SRPBCC family protein, partial [Deltaproteobacteria bacterium]
MIQLDERVPIRTKADEAFLYLADFGNLSAWDPGIARSRRLDTAPLAPGARFEVVARFFGRDVPMAYELVAYDTAARTAELVGTAPGIRATDRISVTAREGGAEVRWRADVEVAGVPGFLSPLMRPLFVRVGAMDVKSFGTVSAGEGIPFNKTIIIVGDRRDIQQRSIALGVRVLVVTGNLPVDADVILAAKAAGVSLMVSPYDSATTAWIIRSATTLERLVDRKFASLSADLRIGELRKKLSTSTIPSYMVVDDEGKLQGILTRTDVLKPVKTRLVLVDHNEMTQAVSGADQVTIVEIIDHHRLGSLNTQHPILFINEPVGSTCTIIADLFRRDGLIPATRTQPKLE